MNKQELIQLIDILDKSEVHIKTGAEILVFVDFCNLEQFTKILGIDSENYITCILRNKYVIVNLVDIDILDCEEIEIIENRYKKKEEEQ